MLTDDEIKTMWSHVPYIDEPQGGVNFARAIIAAYQAKLLAGVEMPEPTIITDMDWCEIETYDTSDLQQYAAACAAQARMKALDEAKMACLNLYANLNEDLDCRKYWPEQLRVNTIYATVIEQLKVKL